MPREHTLTVHYPLPKSNTTYQGSNSPYPVMQHMEQPFGFGGPYSNVMHQYRNIFPVDCDDKCVFGIHVKHVNTSALPSHVVVYPDAVLRFCTHTGDALISDLLYAMYRQSQHTSARIVIGNYLDENITYLRTLGVKLNVKIHKNVRVTILLQ